MRPINPMLCLAVGMIATVWAGGSRSAETIDDLPKDLTQQVRMNCTAKPGDYIEIAVQCYYEWLQLEIRRNQKIRDLIGQGLEHWAVEIMGATNATNHFSQAHKSWLEYGQMHCEMLPLDISQNKSRNANIVSSGCWLELYASYSNYLLKRYNQLALEEYSRQERLK